MLRLAHGFVLFLLFFTGLTATLGGLALMLDPSGSLLGLSDALLWHSPFASFYLPGVVLFAALGVGSFLTVVRVVRRRPQYPASIMVQGALIYFWILAEMFFIRQAHWLQLLFAGIGIALFDTGARISRKLAKRQNR